MRLCVNTINLFDAQIDSWTWQIVADVLISEQPKHLPRVNKSMRQEKTRFETFTWNVRIQFNVNVCAILFMSQFKEESSQLD